MTRPPEPIDRSKVDPDAPLRLDVAARLAFPDGSIGVSALRSEAKKGRLVLLKIAGKDMTTLAAIDAMIALCRVAPAAPANPVSPPRKQLAQPSRDERFAIARAAAQERVDKLRQR